MDREDRSDRDNKKIRNAKRSGKFRSGLEKHMSESLKNFSIPYEYEKLKYVLMEKFVFAGSSYERMKSGDKIVFKEDSRATRGITYTPDFSIETERSIFIIECKGHKTDAFILKWKLFKCMISQTERERNIFLYMPTSKDECIKTCLDIREKIKALG